MLTLGQAARIAGVGKTTLTRAIKSGRMSATKRDDGVYQIDPAELSRVYDIKVGTRETVAATGGVVHQATPPGHPDDVLKLAAAEGELVGAREMINHLKTQIDDLRSDRDGWRQQSEAVQRVLTYVSPQAAPQPQPSPQPPRIAKAAPAPRRSWWKFSLAGS